MVIPWNRGPSGAVIEPGPGRFSHPHSPMGNGV